MRHSLDTFCVEQVLIDANLVIIFILHRRCRVVHGFANTHRINRRHSWIRPKYAFDLFGNYSTFDNLADHSMTQIVISPSSPLPHFTFAWNAVKQKATLVISVCDRMKNCLLFLSCLLSLSLSLSFSLPLNQLVFKFRLKCHIKAKLVIRNRKKTHTQITINRAWNRNGIFYGIVSTLYAPINAGSM